LANQLVGHQHEQIKGSTTNTSIKGMAVDLNILALV
jgi:hypothetical protein